MIPFTIIRSVKTIKEIGYSIYQSSPVFLLNFSAKISQQLRNLPSSVDILVGANLGKLSKQVLSSSSIENEMWNFLQVNFGFEPLQKFPETVIK